ncbi:Uncharacterized membrane protein YheB, UPF0754 family [Halobacillus karajensis]|uniref:DUF445 domain-containing protein n=1 Tax=Halobacillus karajensis TaxID=195088 RepID=UPI0008A7F92A|nr:DUF445 family protein [Halobacillus karajensis]SEH95942.1 Uncharacterized membrane protein YheB, UPF0754 family [Halobacillus karajensis]
MNPIILIFLMIGIGALIGGLTNSLAIKMLFRPYRAIYIGRFRLPFTPGLIPKRQKELAQQLGKMVVNHLLTPEGIRRKLAHPAFQEQMISMAKDEVHSLLKKEETVKDVLETFQMEVTATTMKRHIAGWVEERYRMIMDDYQDYTIEDLMTQEMLEKANRGVDRAAIHIQESIENYFRSSEGKEKVASLIDHYLDNQGFLGNMISSFMGAEGLTERIYPLILKYISDREMEEWLQTMLHTEKDKVLQKRVKWVEAQLGHDRLAAKLGDLVANALPVEKWMSKTVGEWTRPYQENILEHFVPRAVHQLSDLLSSKVESMMANMRLSEIVQEEVEAFQVERLEDMVLGISRREFKMITYLGALLGGMIGLLQAIIVLFFG